MRIFGREIENKILIKKIVSNGVQFVIFVAVVWGISRWQAKELLPQERVAPDFSLQSIDGKQYNLSDYGDRKVVIYFFSPWCSVCKYSSHNIADIYSKNRDMRLNVFAIALSWKSVNEVKSFAMKHKLNMPVLLGDNRVAKDYKINSFPTIYILKKGGIVYNRVVGYTTEMGIKLRIP